MMAELQLLESIIGEQNLQRGIESVVKERRREMADALAGNDGDVTQVEAYDMIEDMEDKTIDEIDGSLPGLSEPMLRLMAQYSLQEYLAGDRS